jgi:hypothetical protein
MRDDVAAAGFPRIPIMAVACRIGQSALSQSAYHVSCW